MKDFIILLISNISVKIAQLHDGLIAEKITQQEYDEMTSLIELELFFIHQM